MERNRKSHLFIISMACLTLFVPVAMAALVDAGSGNYTFDLEAPNPWNQVATFDDVGGGSITFLADAGLLVDQAWSPAALNLQTAGYAVTLNDGAGIENPNADGVAVYFQEAGSLTLLQGAGTTSITGGLLGVLVAHDLTLDNAGTITGGDDGIVVNSAGAVTIDNTNLITGGWTGIFVVDGGLEVINAGQITGTNLFEVGDFGEGGASIGGVGIDMLGGVVENSGDILGTAVGIRAFGDVATITNTTGTISGSAGIEAGGDGVYGGVGIFLQGTLADTLVQNEAGAEITGGLAGIIVESGVAEVVNAGTITGGASGISVDGGALDLTNSGTITGGDDGIIVENAGGVAVYNTDLITGGWTGIFVVDGGLDVFNDGQITGTNLFEVVVGEDETSIGGIGIDMLGGVIENTGDISGTAVGIRAFDDVATIINTSLMEEGGGGIVQTGTIRGLAESQAGVNDVYGGVGILLQGMQAGTFVQNDQAAEISGGLAGIIVEGGVAEVENMGTITGVASGISVDGGVLDLTNYGQISGTKVLELDGEGEPIDGGIGVELVNAGMGTVIDNMGQDAEISGPLAGIGVFGGETLIYNEGTISGQAAGIGVLDGGVAEIDNVGTITGGWSGVDVYGGILDLINYGTIEATEIDENAGVLDDGGVAVFVESATPEDIQGIANVGTISGVYAGIEAEGGIVEIINTSLVDGQGAVLQTGTISGVATVADVVIGGVGIELMGTQEGTFILNDEGALIEGGDAGIVVESGQAVIQNYGAVTGGQAGIWAADGADVDLYNAGTIDGGGFGVIVMDSLAEIVNTGTIESGEHSVKLNNAAAGTLIENLAGGQISSGIDIVGGYGDIYNAEGATISRSNSGFVIDTSAVDSTIENRGTISGIEAFTVDGSGNVVERSIGIGLVSVDGAVSTTIENYGTIEGSYAGILAEVEPGGTSIQTTLDNYGTIRGTAEVIETDNFYGGGAGVWLQDTAVDTTVTNRGGALIEGGRAGVLVEGGLATIINEVGATISSGNTGIELAPGADAAVINQGLVEGDMIGLWLENGTMDVTNSGTIAGYADLVAENDGGLVYSGSVGVHLEDSSAGITNESSGLITGDGAGIYAQNSTVVIDNHGTIRGLADIIEVDMEGDPYHFGGKGVWLQGAAAGTTVTNFEGGLISGGHQGIYVEDGFAEIINVGTIRGTDADSHGMSLNRTDAGTSIVNEGRIAGGFAGIVMDEIAHLLAVTNQGEIDGGVFGIHADDVAATIENTGWITGGESAISIEGDSVVSILNQEDAVIRGVFTGIDSSSSDIVIDNYGRIEGGYSGVSLFMEEPEVGVIIDADTMTVNNDGIISGGAFAVEVHETKVGSQTTINHNAGVLQATGLTAATRAAIDAEFPGYVIPEFAGTTAIFFGEGVDGAVEVNLSADVIGDIRHDGASTGALLWLDQGAAQSTSVNGDILWGDGTLVQNDGVWTLGDVSAGLVQMVGGQMTADNVTADEVGVDGGQMTVSGGVDSAQVGVTGGTLTAGDMDADTVSVAVGTLTVDNTLTAATSATLTSGELTTGNLTAGEVTVLNGQMTVDNMLTADTSVGIADGDLSANEVTAQTVTVSGGVMTVADELNATTSVSVSDGELTANDIMTDTVSVSGGSLTADRTLNATTSVGVTGGTLTAGDIETDAVSVAVGTLTVDNTLNATTSVTVTSGELTAGHVTTDAVAVGGGTMTVDGLLTADTSVGITGGQLLTNNLTTSAVTVDGGLLAIDGVMSTGTAAINQGGTLRLAGGVGHVYDTLSMQRGGTIAASGLLELNADPGAADQQFILLNEGAGAYGFDTAMGRIAVADLTLGQASTFDVNPNGQELVLRNLDTNSNIATLGEGVLRLTGGDTAIGSNGVDYFELASALGSTVIVDFTGGTIGHEMFNKAVNTTLLGDIAFSGAAAEFLPNVEYDEPSNTLTATDYDFTGGISIATPEGGTLRLTGTTRLDAGVNPFIGSGTFSVDAFDVFSGPTTMDFRGGGTLNLDVLPEDTDPLTLTGAGRFNLGQPGNVTDSSDYTGQITLGGSDSLVLVLNSDVGGNVQLDNPNSELWGVGTIGVNLSILQGWHRPGNSIGVQIVEGAYQIGAGGTLEIEFDAGQDNCDRVDVTGDVTINPGATLRLIGIGGTAEGTTYTYLTAGGVGGITGTFDNTLFPAIYEISFDYLANSAMFTIDSILDVQDVLPGATGNQVAMFNALEAAGKMDLLTGKDMGRALTELAPEPYRANRMATMGQAQMMAGQWSSYSRQMRPVYGQVNTMDYFAQAPASVSGGLAAATDYRNPYAMGGARSGVSDDGWGAFLRPFGQYGSQDSGMDRTGFTFRTAGIVAGVDKVISDDTIAGLGLGYTHSAVRFKQSRGKSDIDSLRAGPYVSFMMDDTRIDASLSAGMHWFDMTKRMPELGLVATNDHKGYDVSAYLGASMAYEYDRWTVSPGASLQYTHLWEDSFSEQGAGTANQRLDSQRTHSLRSLLGATFVGKEDFIWNNTKPTLYAGWSLEMLDNDTTVTGRFVDAPDTAFRVKAAGPGRNSGVFGAGLNFEVNETTNGFINYQAEISSRSDYHTLMGGVSWSF